jgi:ERF superfamily
MSKTTTRKKADAGDELFAPPAQTADEAAKGKAVAKREPKSVPIKTAEERVVPMTGIAEILGVFERLAVNPNVNPDSLDKLLAVQERLIDRNAKLAFDQAFVAMTPKLPLIRKEGRIIVREKTASGKRDGEETQNTPYPKWETTGEQIKPVLAEYGFGLGHRIGSVIDGGERRVRVTAILRHVGGHTDDGCYFDLPADTTGSKNNNQAWASSVTYAKRHTAFAVLGLVTEGDDDDAARTGRAVVLGEPLTPEELEKLIEFAGAVQCPEARLVKHLNSKRPKGHPEIEKIADLPCGRFEEAIEALRSYEQNAKAREASKGVQGKAS